MRLLISTCLILAAASATSAQCPTVTVIGPAGDTALGDEMVIRAELSVMVPNVSYSWTLDKGTIVRGQGTSEISAMLMLDQAGTSITATVEVNGLPSACTRTASGTFGIAITGDVFPIDEFGQLAKNDERGRLDLFFQELRRQTANIGYVDIYQTDRKKAEARMRFYMSHIRFRKFDASRLRFRLGVKPEPKTVLWSIAEGYDPWCDGCTVISGEDLK